MNNAAFASVYARVRWGLERVAVIDIDVHFGNGTAELLRGDPRSFFASVHMIYGPENAGITPPEDSNFDMHSDLPAASANGFYPAELGRTEIEDNYVSVGVYPAYAAEKKDSRRRVPVQVPKESLSKDQDNDVEGDDEGDGDGDDEVEVKVEGEENEEDTADDNNTLERRSAKKKSSSHHRKKKDSVKATPVIEPLFGVQGYRRALTEHILPRMEAFRPQLLIISAGFDGFHTDPLGGDLGLSLEDYVWSTQQVCDIDTVCVE